MAAVLVLVLAAAAAFVVLAGGSGGGNEEAARQALRDAGCRVQTFPGLPADHVATPPKRSEYNSWPPTSGPHANSPAPYGEYTDPIQQYLLVHNLEHGSLVVQYGDKVPSETADEVRSWYRTNPNGIVIAPFAQLGRDIALAAWTTPKDDAEAKATGVLARCPRFDEKAFKGFKAAYAFRAPERFPQELLTPGS